MFTDGDVWGDEKKGGGGGTNEGKEGVSRWGGGKAEVCSRFEHHRDK